MKLIKACAVLTTAVMMSGCALVCKTQHTKQTETDCSYTTTTVTQYGLFGLSDTRKYGNKTTQGIAGLFLPLYASKTEDVKWKTDAEREVAKKQITHPPKPPSKRVGDESAEPVSEKEESSAK